MSKVRPAQAPILIQSKDNPRFRSALDLVQSSRERRKRHQTFIEGIHLCRAFEQGGGTPLQILSTELALQNAEVAALWNRTSQEHCLLSAGLFRELSQVDNGVAIAYVIDTPRAELPETITSTSVYLDRVQDPGNIGSILRCCAAAGVGNLITSPGSAFCWAPKVLRAAMGAHFLVNIFEGVTWQSLKPRVRISRLATAANAAQTLWDAKLSEPCLWMFGNEGAGLAAEIGAQVDRWISIPINPQVESLNVAAAAAVCLFEQRRQQR